MPEAEVVQLSPVVRAVRVVQVEAVRVQVTLELAEMQLFTEAEEVPGHPV
jgi:hypothetical protein